MKKLFIILSTVSTILFISCSKEDIKVKENKNIKSAKYKVRFNFNWSEANFPIDYPSGAHFSKLIAWSHNSQSNFFEVKTPASKGIESMAETGSTIILSEEINNRILKGEGYKLYVGSGLSSGTSSIEIELEVNEENTSITLATMIAPSPDWYVAIVNINLVEKGVFVQQKTVEGLVYDAGTDDGKSYTSSNLDSNPKGVISLITKPPLGDGNNLKHPICLVSIELIE